MFCKKKNIEIEYSPPRPHTCTIAVKRAIQTQKNLISASLENEISFTDCINRALRVMGFSIHTALKMSSFEIQHGRELRTELTNIVKDNQSFLPNWTPLSASVQPKQIPFYKACKEKREVMDHILITKKTNPLLHVTQVTEEKDGKAG